MKKLLIGIISSLCIVASASPAFASDFNNQVENAMNEIYVYNGIQNTDTAHWESKAIQAEIAALRQNVEQLGISIVNDSTLTTAELVRLENQIAQCLKALESLTA